VSLHEFHPEIDVVCLLILADISIMKPCGIWRSYPVSFSEIVVEFHDLGGKFPETCLSVHADVSVCKGLLLFLVRLFADCNKFDYVMINSIDKSVITELAS
jgi:hypothetical protein